MLDQLYLADAEYAALEDAEYDALEVELINHQKKISSSNIGRMSKSDYTEAEQIAYAKGRARAKPKARSKAKKSNYRRRPTGGSRGGVNITYPNITGRGDYKMNPRHSYLQRGGGYLGAIAGEGLGRMANNALTYFTGQGDYQVRSNSFLVGADSTSPQIINPNPGGGTSYNRTEYICDVVTGTAGTFDNRGFNVNPGLEATFNWLSQQAANYEEYEIEGMYFEFRSMSADALNSTNTALGQIIMAMSYNAGNALFANKQAMENYEGAISSKPSQSTRYFVECARLKTVLDELYVRQGSVPINQDVRMYDLGLFQVATNGFQASNVNIGELWVTYQVALRKPKLFAALGEYNSYQSMQVFGYTNLLPLGSGTTQFPGAGSNLIGYLQTGITMSWDRPTIPQAYLIQIIWVGAVGVLNQVPTYTMTNGLTSIVLTNSPAFLENGSSVTSQMAISYKPSLNVSNGRPTVTLGTAGILPTTPTYVLVRICQIPNTALGI